VTEPQSVALSAEELYRARQLRRVAIESLTELGRIVGTALGTDSNQFASVTLQLRGDAATEIPTIPCEIFRDEQGNCLGMYCDPPGECSPCAPPISSG
jgi:hypothetical protein